MYDLIASAFLYFNYSSVNLIHYLKLLSISTPRRPMTDTSVSISVHDRNVSLIERPKYSLNNQKAVSFTCEQNKLPAPIDNTSKLGSTCVPLVSVYKIPAAVRPAIVAEPKASRNPAVTIHASTNGGSCHVPSSVASSWLTP